MIAESEADFEGLEISNIEYWKEGVRRVWAMKQNSGTTVTYYIIYADEQLTKNLKITGE
jgi:hypothetical protein